LLGPLAGAYILELLATDLVFLGISPSYAEVIQGVIIVLIVMAGGLAALRQMRRAK
jgi:ribose/xylose/arabinose/galactoside ABC-type transport system permease subunit